MRAELVIDGKQVTPDGGSYPVINPATEEVVGEAPEASEDQVRQAATAARAAWAGWRDLPVGTRAQLVAALGRALSDDAEAMIDLVRAETGAVTAIVEPQQFRHALGFLTKWQRIEDNTFVRPLAPFIGAGPADRLTGAVIHRPPAGVVACITPFNFPLLVAAAMAGPALVAGNTVVIKPAPANPLAVFMLGAAAARAGLPPGVLNVVGGQSPRLGAALVASDDVDMISFTGSTAVGRQVAQSAAAGMKRVLLELGGKGAAIVFPDADLDAAVAGIASTWTRHSGQVCTAPTRVVAHRDVRRELVERLAATAESLVLGDPGDPTVTVGPLTTAGHRNRVNGYISSAQADGARLVAGGADGPGRGWYVRPTLFTDCSPGMRIIAEEVFGPVVAVTSAFDDLDSAAALASDSAFGLHDYVWSADTARAYELARRLRTGYVGINTMARSPDAPFGGFGASGLGRDGGLFSLEAYTEPQSIIWAG
jgi:acyl-CoA reductase-like NAD-dependent aldehyde dehydrogenase